MSISLAERAKRIRRSIIHMLSHAQSGHSAGALGMADVLSVLYFDVARHDPKKPDWIDRDRIVLSNGHICPVLYATLAEAGYFSRNELFTLRSLHSRLQGHPHRGSLPGIENSSGPLGQGLSQAIGIALALRLRKLDAHVFCILSDGELQEGQTWEAVLFAAKMQLANLTILIDRNYIQISGRTEEVLPLDPLVDKFASFGLDTISIDGHDHAKLSSVLRPERHVNTDRQSLTTKVVICNTTPGKGVSFMEDKFEWHGKPPSQEQAEQALRELE